LLPGVVRSHPQAGRPRDLQLHGREQAPPNVLISHQERLGAFDRRQRGGPALANAPLPASRTMPTVYEIEAEEWAASARVLPERKGEAQ
jgi:hypothetical protein